MARHGRSSCIVMVIERYHPIWGGAENQLRQLCRCLVERGCTPRIVTRRWQRSMTTTDSVDGVEVIRLGVPGTSFFATASFVVAMLVYLIVKTGRGDVIHTHGAAALGAVGRVAARLSGARNVAKVATAGRIPKLARDPLRRLVLSNFQRSDRIVCLSEEIRQELAAIGTEASRVAEIPNGVDCDRFKPLPPQDRDAWRRQRGLAEDALLVVSSGRLVPRKGVQVLLEAWPSIVAAHPNAHLVILGSGRDQPDSIEHDLKTATRDNRLANVHFDGETPTPEAVLGVSDVFVLSSFQEGFPNTLLEAMAAGLATVSSRIGGVVDLLDGEDVGLTVEAGDSGAFAASVGTLLGDADARVQMGQRARAHIQARFSLPAVAETYSEVYQTLTAA